MQQQLRVAALRYRLWVALNAFTLAQDYNRDDHDRGDRAQTRQYGYQSGFQDGQCQGRHEGARMTPSTTAARLAQATRDYKS